MKERYNVAPWNDGKDAVCKAEDGKYILYTDHLAEIREIVDTYDLLIDRCDKKNSELEDERDGYRNGQQQVQDLLAKQIDNSLKLAAENKRLAALNDMFPQEIARLEDRVSAEYEAERTDDRARIKELEAENKRLREALDLVISFIPDGWGMPLGFNQVAQQAREAIVKMRKYGL